jgi:Aspartyl protease
VIQASRGTLNHLFVPISINGQQRSWWIIDTGAPVSIISTAEASKIGPQLSGSGLGITASTIAETRGAKVFLSSSMVSEGFDFGRENLAVIPLGPANMERVRIIGPWPSRARGIIGLATLSKFGAVINCRVCQIFLNPAGGSLPLSREGYEKVGFVWIPLKLTPDDHLEAVGTIGSRKYSFLIDTGAEFTVITENIRRKENIPFYVPRGVLVGIHDFNKAPVSSGSLPDFRIGDCDLDDARVGFADLNIPVNGFSQPFGGIIGAEVLTTHSAIIDIGNRALYLKPKPSPR